MISIQNNKLIIIGDVLILKSKSTRNKGNAYVEAMQYRQNVFPIAHYHNITLFRKSQ